MVFSTNQFFTCLGFTPGKRQKKFYGSRFQEFDSCRGAVCYITLRAMLNWYDKGRHNKDLSPFGKFIWQKYKSFKIFKDFKVFQTPQHRFSRITEVSKEVWRRALFNIAIQITALQFYTMVIFSTWKNVLKLSNKDRVISWQILVQSYKQKQ